MRESEVLICFDTEKLSNEQLRHIFDAERSLRKAGITFDTGGGHGTRDWEFDWSLDGPVNVYHRKFIEGGDEIAEESPN